MIYNTHAEILTILFKATTAGLTTKEIFKHACDKPNTQIPDPESLSKYIYNLRGKGLLTSSDGKNRIHKITHKGIAALNEFNGASISEESPKIEVNQTKETIETWGTTMTTDKLIEWDPLPPLLSLNPKDELDAKFISIIESLRESKIKPEPVKIEHKNKKINILLQIGRLMNDDIKAVFDEIIADLERFKASSDQQQ